MNKNIIEYGYEGNEPTKNISELLSGDIWFDHRKIVRDLLKDDINENSKNTIKLWNYYKHSMMAIIGVLSKYDTLGTNDIKVNNYFEYHNTIIEATDIYLKYIMEMHKNTGEPIEISDEIDLFLKMRKRGIHPYSIHGKEGKTGLTVYAIGNTYRKDQFMSAFEEYKDNCKKELKEYLVFSTKEICHMALDSLVKQIWRKNTNYTTESNL